MVLLNLFFLSANLIESVCSSFLICFVTVFSICFSNYLKYKPWPGQKKKKKEEFTEQTIHCNIKMQELGKANKRITD